MPRKHRIAVVIGLILLIAGCCLLSFIHSPHRRTNNRILRVGVDHSPPFYAFQPDGSVKGLAVEVLNEAARRRGIELKWVRFTDVPLDQALDSKTVDLWPLVGPTKFRQSHFFLSDPWLESDYVLVSLGSHPVRNAADAAGLVIAHARLRMTSMVAQEYLPRSKFLVQPLRAQAVQSVCGGDAAAAVVESQVLDAILLDRPAGCEKKVLRISTLAGADTPLSIAPTREASGLAEELRKEISHLASDGFLSRRLDEWSPFSAEGTRSIWAREAAEQHSRVYSTLAAMTLFCALGLLIVARRALNLKRLAQSAESELREFQRRFSAFMDHSPAVTFMRDLNGGYLYTNASFSRVFGTGLGLPPEQPDFQWVEQGRARQVVESSPDTDGNIRHWLSVRFPFTSENGQRLVGGTSIDITAIEVARQQLAASEERYRDLAHRQQQTLAELQASEERWRLALTGAGDGLWDWDLVSGTVYRSPAWKTMLGYQDSEVGSTPEDWRSRLHPDDLDRVEVDLEAHFQKKTPIFTCDYRILAKDGSWRWVSDRGKAVWDEHGTPVRITGAQTDITARKLEQETLSMEARTDSLTGLWNRREFDRALRAMSELAQKSGRPLTICVFDLDQFKAVNDAHGHGAGDQVLIKFGGVLRESMRKQDISCRIGGDEFVAILPDTSAEEATVLADRVGVSLRLVRFKSPAGIEFRVRCSFGVGEFGAPDLLAAADELLYEAKQKARKRIFAA